MRRGREWLLALLLGVAAVLWGLNLTEQPQPPGQDTVRVNEPPRYVIREGRWLRTNADGTPLFRIESQQIAVYANDRAVIEKPVVNGLGKRDVWSLTAPQGEMPAGTRDLALTDGVEIEGQWGDGAPLKARTPRLIVDVDDRVLRTEKAVRVSGPGRDLRSVGLRTDWDGESLSLLDQVRVTYDGR